MSIAERRNIRITRKPCCNCGSKVNTEKHHIVPLSKGGRDVETNLCWLCRECHMVRIHGYKYDIVTLSGRKHGRNPVTVLNTETESIIERFLSGEIGNKEAMRLLDIPESNHSVRTCRAYKEYERIHGRQPRYTNRVDQRGWRSKHD